jgi:hypothetical protein
MYFYNLFLLSALCISTVHTEGKHYFMNRPIRLGMHVLCAILAAVFSFYKLLV